MTNKYIFLILLIILNLFLLSTFGSNKSATVVTNIINKANFEIIYLNTECSETKEEVYRDEEHIYVSPCIKVANILIKLQTE